MQIISIFPPHLTVILSFVIIIVIIIIIIIEKFVMCLLQLRNKHKRYIS